jgi:hypothetical protein
VVFKAMAARPKDIEDATTLLLLHRDIDVDRARRRLGELAALAEEPALLGGLEIAIEQSRAARAKPERKKPRKPLAKPRKPPAKPRPRAKPKR